MELTPQPVLTKAQIWLNNLPTVAYQFWIATWMARIVVGALTFAALGHALIPTRIGEMQMALVQSILVFIGAAWGIAGGTYGAKRATTDPLIIDADTRRLKALAGLPDSTVTRTTETTTASPAVFIAKPAPEREPGS